MESTAFIWFTGFTGVCQGFTGIAHVLLCSATHDYWFHGALSLYH